MEILAAFIVACIMGAVVGIVAGILRIADTLRWGRTERFWPSFWTHTSLTTVIVFAMGCLKVLFS